MMGLIINSGHINLKMELLKKCFQQNKIIKQFIIFTPVFRHTQQQFFKKITNS
ncbi:hypothetical protein TTHERM_001046963 (macronuclear) [Tetrahymena thermophila SB210]|uniref:Uncharacterized protein n=1 Tax=Tetrahymena thermophila (strain SB210) TaxID=312017 RepID=W7X975_TETTS|nr:hypothetical protein TTHERM_001046963 [Tetrahymena thermophila SB210]EWS73897.1 hypothetical protein TTHERM_001046963 [Tetrahymena thermophila SB210]|eukprot:XP_012653565.1 hypothetical protein TTHERM_001046963 [Tetrahymena thermophila SB210]